MSNSPYLHDSSDSSDVPFAPHPVSAAEVIPGDLIALTPDDAGRSCWYVVTHTLPETPRRSASPCGPRSAAPTTTRCSAATAASSARAAG